MVAEVRLYWIIHKHYLGGLDVDATEASLSLWKQEWLDLFGEPASYVNLSSAEDLQMNPELNSYKWDIISLF